MKTVLLAAAGCLIVAGCASSSPKRPASAALVAPGAPGATNPATTTTTVTSTTASPGQTTSTTARTSTTLGPAPAATVAPSPSMTTPPQTAPPTTAAPSGTVVLRVASSSAGPILVGPNGHTVYLFTQDHGTTSACTGVCAMYWPALKAPAHPVGGPGVDSAKISVANGQIAYNGHLLYFYSGDSAPGQLRGRGIADWYPVTPAGDKA